MRWIIIIEEKLTVKEVADILNLSRSTIYKRLKNGKIDGSKENNKWIIIVSENKNQVIYEKLLEKESRVKWKDINNGFFDREAVDNLLKETRSRFNNMGLLTQAAQNIYDQTQKTFGLVDSIGSHYNFMSEAEKFVQQHKFNTTADIFSRINRKYEMLKFNLGRDFGFSDKKIMSEFEIPKAVNFNLLEPLLDTTINELKRMQNNYQIPNNYFRTSLALNTANFEALNNMGVMINKSIFPQINNFSNIINSQNWDHLNQINKLLYDQINFYVENSLDISNLVKQIDPNLDQQKVEEKIIENDKTKIMTMKDINIIIFTFLLLSFILVWATPENINELSLSIAEVFKPIWEYFKSESFEMSFEFSPDIFIPSKPNLYRRVIEDNVLLRVKPNVIADRVIKLEYNEYVEIVDNKGNWIFVKILNRDKEYVGWLREEEVSNIDRINFD